MKYKAEKINLIAIGATLVLVGLLCIFILGLRKSVDGAIPAQKESATTCAALGSDTYMIRLTDNRVNAPAKALAEGLKNLLNEKKTLACRGSFGI